MSKGMSKFANIIMEVQQTADKKNTTASPKPLVYATSRLDLVVAAY